MNAARIVSPQTGDRVDRVLRVVSWMFVPLAVGCLAGVLLDDRMLGDERVWVKPLKFAVSIGLTGLATAWLRTRLLEDRRLAADPKRLRRIDRASSAVVLALVAEQILISVQAARGVRSHFNTTTALDGLVFNVMGGLIAVAFGGLLMIAFVGRRRRLRDAVTDKVVGHGVGLVLLGSVVGFAMIGVDGHSIGGDDGGPGLPMTNWSTELGDLRPGHFVGLHGLQLLIVAGAISRRRGWSERTRVRLIDVMAGAAAAATVSLVAQALAGRPVTSVSSLVVAAATVAGGAAAFALSGRRCRASRPVDEDDCAFPPASVATPEPAPVGS